LLYNWLISKFSQTILFWKKKKIKKLFPSLDKLTQ